MKFWSWELAKLGHRKLKFEVEVLKNTLFSIYLRYENLSSWNIFNRKDEIFSINHGALMVKANMKKCPLLATPGYWRRTTLPVQLDLETLDVDGDDDGLVENFALIPLLRNAGHLEDRFSSGRGLQVLGKRLNGRLQLYGKRSDGRIRLLGKRGNVRVLSGKEYWARIE